ncbi:hypothetical protein LX90_006422 [Lentzea flava]|nr:hypothetical protein [Lentzea flava]
MPVSVARARKLEAWTVQGDLLGSWVGPDSAAVLALIASFPVAEPMRCYSPAYAILAYSADDEYLFDLEFCYGCYWVGVRGPDDRQHLVPFDPESAPAKELLARFHLLEQSTRD